MYLTDGHNRRRKRRGRHRRESYLRHWKELGGRVEQEGTAVASGVISGITGDDSCEEDRGSDGSAEGMIGHGRHGAGEKRKDRYRYGTRRSCVMAHLAPNTCGCCSAEVVRGDRGLIG